MFVNIMRRTCSLVIVLALFACSDPVSEDLHSRSRIQPQWFEDAKLGIFIHWGLPSVPAFASGPPLQQGELEEILLGDGPRRELPYSEWYLNSKAYSNSETATFHLQQYGDAPYRNFQADFEANVERGWDPNAWAELFESTGARYVVMVAKHHDGYSLWPTNIENPNQQEWHSSRDLVGELAQAVRSRGIRFGVYYSTGLDWSFKMVTDGDFVSDVMRSAPASQTYADYAYNQSIELIDRYAPAVFWADIGYPSKGRLDELFRHYFQQVPDGAVNDRWGPVDILGQIAEWPGGTWLLKTLAAWTLDNQPGDIFDDPERIGYKTTEYSNLSDTAAFKWESTRGLGGSFGFNRNETSADMLSGSELIVYLVDTVSKNGNVLINVGPDSYGAIPQIQQTPLRELGTWMKLNGEAVYNTRPWRRFSNNIGRALRYTESDEALYAIVSGAVKNRFTIEHPGIPFSRVQVLGAKVLSVRELSGSLELELDQTITSPAVVVRYTK
ncbi:MAG: alpha-L-fucosidase [Halieaceae bacterium]|jgi:alpha-L-fucosidase